MIRYIAFGSLFVADWNNDRVLVFTPVPSATGAAASAVLGQIDFTTGISNPFAPVQNRMNGPLGLAVAGDRLYVVDNGFNRVLRFDLNPM